MDSDLMRWVKAQADDPNANPRFRELLAALEAAREDACVALVADIRFACGDNGKRSQPELVEYIRGLARDAARYRWLREECKSPIGGLTIASVTEWGLEGWSGDDPDNRIDAAIDQARWKAGQEDRND